MKVEPSIFMRLNLLPVAAVCLATTATLFAEQPQPEDLPQAPTPQPTAMKLADGVVVERATPGALPLSIDQAIDLGLKHNLQIQLSVANQKLVHGEVLTVKNNLLPTMTAEAKTSTQQINLAAMGFKPSLFSASSIPGLPAGLSIPTIVKVDVTSAQLNVQQALFNVPAYYLYRAAQKADQIASWEMLNQRGNVALSVGTQYLRTVADAAEIDNARALLAADEVALKQAKDSQEAGVGTHLDVLRSQVQMQTQQQTLINDENQFAKDKIALNRLMGIPAEQELTLTDAAPYAEYAALPLDDAMKLAFERRKDYRSLQAQQELADRTLKAVKFQRLPSLSFSGFYGVLGETHGLYHGVFSAGGKLSFPIFEEGQLRGEREVAQAQLQGVHSQIDSLKVTIEQQIRSAMLDVQATDELVKVARSNVDLAAQALSDTSDRYKAGVDDNLPVVQAQASLAQAKSQLVQTLYQFNQAKLQLARNTGVVETQYKSYLGQ